MSKSSIPNKFSQDILVYGMHRSGSTFIWMVLEEIYKKQIFKTHHYIPNKKTIITYRDPRDIAASLFRMRKDMGKRFTVKNNIVSFKEKNWKEIRNLVRPHINIFLKYKNNPNDNYLFLKYEDFFNNFDFIFNKLSLFLNKEIDKKTRDYIITLRASREVLNLPIRNVGFIVKLFFVILSCS